MMAMAGASHVAQADEMAGYCPALRDVAAGVRAKDRTFPLPGWADRAFYGTRTYACDSRPFNSAVDAGRAFAEVLGEVKSCLRDGWPEDQTRASPGYAVVHDERQVASITINTDQTDKNEHVVRLILFLRSP
jgi:hypothetical protein